MVTLPIAPFTIGPEPTLLAPLMPDAPWRAFAVKIDLARVVVAHGVAITLAYSTDGGMTWQEFMHATIGDGVAVDKQGVTHTVSDLVWWYQDHEPAQDPDGVQLGAFVRSDMPVLSDGGVLVVG
ncbi:MAG TPA: hypothetical protein VJN95_08780 [Gemmatimonadales bacterium]|nr:hypothetical protein [Gemmatimonadales bacterium]